MKFITYRNLAYRNKGALVRQQSNRIIGLLAVVLMAALVSGCAGPSGSVPIDERGRGGRAPQVTSGTHVVNRGETLYQIAFRYGWDWKALAAHNGLREPYTIYPGQRLNLAVRTASAPRYSAAAAPVRTAQRSAPPPKTAPRSVSPTPPRPVKPAPVPTPVASAPVKGWQWPAQGPLIARFQSNDSLNKGIDIAGQLGQPVKSAANGTVVYAGRGLIGYGEMIIVKHDDTHLSAYAHNSRLLVKEGEQVKGGQQIAEMGSSGTDRVKLHFEIRRGGQPVDPLGYLPKL